MRKNIVLSLGFLLLATVFFAFQRTSPIAAEDPDLYYHIALSRLMVESGQAVLRSLPQVEDLHWGENFVDKEFLFHQLTALAYWIGGENGVHFAPLLCGLLGLLLMLWFAGRHLPPTVAVLATFVTFFSPYLLVRLTLLRPHSLAILCFLLMNLAVLARRPFLVAAAAFLFALSYHAFYMPAVCLGFVGMLSFLETKEKTLEWRRVSLFGLLGVAAGVLLNPYFYGNVDMAIIHARIPSLIKNEAKDLLFGEELYPLRSDAFFEVFHLPLFVIAAAIFLIGLEWGKKNEESQAKRMRLLYLTGISCLFLYVSFQTKRGGEYLLPATGLLGIYLLQSLPQRFIALAYLVPLAFIVSQGSILLITVKAESRPNIPVMMKGTLDSIASIPEKSRGAKVYNCEWDRSPFLLYARPDLRFVDILEPSLLYYKNPAAFRARVNLRKGYIANAHGMIRDAAKASFVFCADPAIKAQLLADPGFQQISPPSNNSLVPTTFRVREQDLPQYVRAYVIYRIGSYASAQRPMHFESDPTELKTEIEGAQPYIELAPLLAAKQNRGNTSPAGDLNCASLKPGESEITRRAGATSIVIGGGQRIELWRNGRPLFRSPIYSTNSSTQVTVPLSPPLKKGENLELLVCASTSSPFWGVSLSLWTDQELQSICDWKKEYLHSSPPQATSWEFQGPQRVNCLAPYAAKSKP